MKKVNKTGYVYRHKKIVFNSLPVQSTPQRGGKELDKFDTIFPSKEEYDKWYRGMIIGLAELDQCLNYCRHFVREKGNQGKYVRDGKSYPVDGTWCGLQDYGRGESGKFFKWVIENFGENWYELMDRYK